MKRISLCVLSLQLFALVSVASAQDPRFDGRKSAPGIAPAVAVAEVSPEMWYYQQQIQRYDDPWQAVRRNAEQRAAQRQARVAAQKWYGYSKARPTANATPWGVTYSPQWSGNTYRPFNWAMNPRTVLVPYPTDMSRN
jgi:hypothetical protein